MTRSSGHDGGRKAPPTDSIFEADAIGEEHLAALRRYDILDTEREKAFDRLTELAADLFDVELGFVAFLDTDQDWVRSNAGLSAVEACLVGTLCTRTIREGGLVTVDDITADERLDNGPVDEKLGLRFYAGVPIMAPSGPSIGTFSILGSKAKVLSDKEKRRLRDLGEMASEALERRREAREHEQAARRRERLARRFSAVLQDPNVVVAVLSPEGTLLEINDAALRYVKESKEEILGLELWETPWWPEETKTQVHQWVQRAGGGEYVDFETNLLGPDGTSHHVEGRIRPVTDEDGQTECLVVSARDVTERQRQAKQLRMLSKAVEQAGEAILITEATPLSEPGPRVVYVNEAFEDMTGWTKEDIRGKTPRVLQGPATDREVLDSLRTALEAGEKWEGETINYRKDGTPYEVRWKIAPVPGEEGEIEYWVSVQRDVTDIRKRERQISGAKNEAEEASRLKSAMLANMSHEIRTPLTSIEGFSQVLKENLTGELAVFATKVHESSQRLHQTLESVLHLSKLEAGADQLDQEEVALGKVASDVVALMNDDTSEKSLAVAVETPDSPVIGFWNEDAVHRICRNLLENAIKFTPDEGQINVRVWEGQEAAVLDVEDTGIGMDPEKVSGLFKAFKQESEGWAREYEGTGLGLSIVKRLTEELGGTIEVETQKGKGTCFTVRLPLSNVPS